MSRSIVWLIAAVTLCLITLNSTAQIIAPAPYSGVNKVNYVRTWDAVRPDSNASHFNMSSDLSESILNTQYIDGLGRPIESVVKKGSLVTGNTSTDLVVPVLFDEFGQQRYQYLPFAANTTGGNSSLNDGQFKLNPFQQDSSFCKSQYSGESSYNQINISENSNLRRPVETFAPGDSWSGTSIQTSESNRRSARIKYWFNT
ncbi:MAG: DUF6443 domain-containing protein, partial [Chitinophagaceae bacterium]